VFFTHGLYGDAMPSPRQTFVNLWHGDGIKVEVDRATTRRPMHPSHFLVGGTTVLTARKANTFRVPEEGQLLTGNPRVDQFSRGVPDDFWDEVGIDPSQGMMNEVSLPGVELIHGRAEALPREAASSDFVSMGYALRHIDDVGAAFAEFFRVLRPGGRLLVLEISKPAGRVGTALLKTYMRAVVPTIARVVAHRRDTAQLWRYYWDTIEACIAPEQVLGSLRTAGFESVKRHVELGVFSEYTAVKPG